MFYLPGMCTHTDTGENRERPESGISSEKNTIFNEHPVHLNDLERVLNPEWLPAAAQIN